MNSQLVTWIISLGAWNWFILAALLFLIETLAPGSFMMWLGLSAILVGIISFAVASFAVAWSWQAQLIAFAVFAVAAIPLWRHFARKVGRPTDRPFLNRRAEGYVGREFTLETPIVDGIGTVRIDDTVWRERSDALPAAASGRAPTGRTMVGGVIKPPRPQPGRGSARSRPACRLRLPSAR
jgi:membrane protein implicated in regulation of membrane protease activity